MQSSARIAPVSKDGKIALNFPINSGNTGFYTPPSAGTIYLFSGKNVATFTILQNGVQVCSNSSIVSFSVAAKDAISVSITRADSSQAASFEFYFSPLSFINTYTIPDLSVSGDMSRYLYLAYGSTVICVDSNLLTLANTKTITAITNNGTSLTLTCASHGFSNGNTISLVDIGGFSSDINHQPYSLTNVTTNTFDITVTVTGTWNSVGYLASAWITNPIVATISLPTNSGTWTWVSCVYRNRDKSLYFIGYASGTAIPVICSIDADPSSGTWNTVRNWDKSTSNTATSYGGSNDVPLLSPRSTVYDVSGDRFLICGNARTYYLNCGTSAPTVSLLSRWCYQGGLLSFFAYHSGVYFLTTSGDGIIAITDSLQDGVVLNAGAGFNNPVYSTSTNKLWIKSNGATVYSINADSKPAIQTTVASTPAISATGCSIASRGKIYFCRTVSTFSFNTTVDVYVWDETGNSTGTSESIYIPTPSSAATTLTQAQYSRYADKVFVTDNGASGRMHIFDPSRASGKKYIGYLNIGGNCYSMAQNHLSNAG